MFKRVDYLTIIKIALLEFGFDTMMHVIMFIIVWDVLVHVILKEDVQNEGDDVLVSSIVCVGDRKDESRTGRKDVSEAGKNETKTVLLIEERLGESQGILKDVVKGDKQNSLYVETDAKMNVDKNDCMDEQEVDEIDDKMADVEFEELLEANNEVKLGLHDRVEESFLRSRNHMRFGDYAMIDNVKYFGECSTSIIWSFYVVEGSCIETARLRYNKKIRGVRCRCARGTVKGLQKMAIFAKEDVGEIITTFKSLCEIKHK